MSLSATPLNQGLPNHQYSLPTVTMIILSFHTGTYLTGGAMFSYWPLSLPILLM